MSADEREHGFVRTDAYHCPVEVAMEIVGRRWTAVLLAQPKEAPRRYSELQRLVPDISDKMLTQRLAELSKSDLVRRPEIVDAGGACYELTDLGRSLAPALQALYDWGQTWADTHGLVIEPVEPPDTFLERRS